MQKCIDIKLVNNLMFSYNILLIFVGLCYKENLLIFN